MQRVAFSPSGFLGNRAVVSYLSNLETLPSALLFSGPEGVGKCHLAKAFAAAYAKPCDVRMLTPEGNARMHPIENIRTLISDLALPPYESQHKMVIIDDADRMLPYAANALLKTLEEPPPYAHMILISSHPDQLLATILSRCTELKFQPLARADILTYLQKHAPSDPDRLATLAQGSLTRVQKLLSGELDVQSVIAFLTQSGPIPDGDPEEILPLIAYWYRDLHALKAGIDPTQLFYAEHLPELQMQVKRPIKSMEEVHAILSRANIAATRGIKLKLSLTDLACS